MPQRHRGARGQSLTEFALVLPVLMLVFTGIIQFGFLLSGQIGLINGVREAARYGSVSPTSAGNASANGGTVASYLRDSVLPANMAGFDASRLALVRVCYSGYLDPSGSTYSVRMVVETRYRHPLFVPLVGVIVDGLDGAMDESLSLGASEQFRVENLPLESEPFPSGEVCVESGP